MTILSLRSAALLKRQGFHLDPLLFLEATEEPPVGGVRTHLGPALADNGTDMVLLDLLWRLRTSEGVDHWDQSGPLTEGLRLLGLLLDLPAPPRRIVCYSGALTSSPLFNFAFRDPVALRLDCGVLDLPPTGPIPVGATEVCFYDGFTFADDLVPIVNGEPSTPTLPGPSLEQLDDLGLRSEAHPVRCLLEVESHIGTRGEEGGTFVGGEVLSRFCREKKRPKPMPRPARDAIRNAGLLHLGLHEWLVTRQVIRHIAGYDQLI